MQVGWGGFTKVWKQRRKDWLSKVNTCGDANLGHELVVEMATHLRESNASWLRSVKHAPSFSQQLQKLELHCGKHGLLSKNTCGTTGTAPDNLMACVEHMSGHVVVSLREPVSRVPRVHDWESGGNYLRCAATCMRGGGVL